MKRLLALFVLALSMVSMAQADTFLSIEEPADGSVKQGVSNLRGWAVSDDPILAVVYYIDGIYMGEIPYGSERQDVGDNYPDIQNSNLSGYSMALYWGLFDDDLTHLLEVVSITDIGEVTEESAWFGVERFKEGEWQKEASTAFTHFEGDDNGFTLTGIVIGGTFYPSVSFEWSDATQGFVIMDIQQ